MFGIIVQVQKIYQASFSLSVYLLFSALKNKLWGHRVEDCDMESVNKMGL